MTEQEILSHVDHTLLDPTSTWQRIREILDDAMAYSTASACIPPAFVKQAKEYVGSRLAICTVIGFPLGYQTTEVKVFETADAVKNGADEIDMVIHQGYVKEGKYALVQEEISAVRKACEGKILKVIIETCNLTAEEKKELCTVVGNAGADFIKTSTGFGSAGATVEDVTIFSQNVPAGLRIKAAGGIASLEDAKTFLELGAERLGTSRVIKIVKEKAKGE